MRRKLAMLLATALAGGMIAIGSASPASATHCEAISTDDPVIIYSCRVVDAAPPIKDTIAYYANLAADLAFGTAHWAYCQVSPYC